LPAVIGMRGAQHNNLRDVDADMPLLRTSRWLRRRPSETAQLL
jgi:hypothetical protein